MPITYRHSTLSKKSGFFDSSNLLISSKIGFWNYYGKLFNIFKKLHLKNIFRHFCAILRHILSFYIFSFK